MENMENSPSFLRRIPRPGAVGRGRAGQSFPLAEGYQSVRGVRSGRGDFCAKYKMAAPPQ